VRIVDAKRGAALRVRIFLAAALASFPCAGQACSASATNVFFASGSAVIPADQAARLDDFAEGLVRQGPGSGVLIGGFSDTVGSPSSNLELARRRAEAVRVYLQARGIPDGSIELRSLGETLLLLSTADGVAEPRNRRVTIVEVVEPLEQAARRTAQRASGQPIPLC